VSRRKRDPIDRGAQLRAIFDSFHTFLKSGSNRRIVLSRDDGGFRVDLGSEETVHGGTLADAAAQAGTVINATEAPT
jgi:hypothetical protein